MQEPFGDRPGRLLKVHNRHGGFTGDVDKVEMILEAFSAVGNFDGRDETVLLEQAYMNEAGSPSTYNDVKNRVELAIMIADITPHYDTFQQYHQTATLVALRG